ncbi:zinc-ribbon domain containing protein [Piscinibacter terrae]|uniref:zinc-ribbon domain containing protein n=1 Tax=Piscinibacter terrae TaxID=2496871 RepID=UPI001F157B22|nr:zinc-ribbon domain containing protein [Albitalea terrae]
MRAAKERAALLKNQVVVNVDKLRPTNSFGTPDFVARGFYADRPFNCKTCASPQVWTATQQRWWYEIAQGDVWTVAVLCRPCRRRERERRNDAREVHLAGLAKKASKR